MFAPTRIWRKWHRKINTNQKRYAVASALAASALPSLVMARGHHVSQVPEIPCVVPTATEALQKTKQAIAALTAAGAYDDVQKVKDSRKLRSGKGKMRNRRHVQRLGPLVVYNEDQGIVRAFRNLPGVDLANVERLNLLQLAPGGHMGRFIIWTKAAFERLNEVYKNKSDYALPQNIMGNSDLTRLINSDEIQSKLRPTNTKVVRARHKKNPLKNLGVMVRLNPYALRLRRAELLQAKRKSDARGKEAKPAVQKTKQTNKRKKANYDRINADDEPAAGTPGAGAAEPAKEAKVEAKAEPKAEAPKAEAPKADAPKADAPKADAPKAAAKKKGADY
jgi:large subunit ribosomal protein L4e